MRRQQPSYQPRAEQWGGVEEEDERREEVRGGERRKRTEGFLRMEVHLIYWIFDRIFNM